MGQAFMIIYWTSIDHSEHATLAASHLLDAVLNGLLCMGHVLVMIIHKRD
jgi:hypothetical protein